MGPEIVPLTDDELLAVADDPALANKFTSEERRRLTRIRPQAAAPTDERGWGDTIRDVATGVVKGAGHTVTGLGQLAYDYIPGVRQTSDAVQHAVFGDVIPGTQLMDSARGGVLAPHGTAQQVGFAGEQLGEFFIPAAKAGVLAKVPGVSRVAGRAIPAAQAALTTGAHGGSGTEAGVSGAITAAIPGGAQLQGAAGRMRTGAHKEMAQALGATKEWAKSEAADLAPQMLQRGVRGSREAMYAQARTTAKAVGQKLDDAYRSAAQAGDAVKGDIVRGNIQLSRDALMTADAAGKRVAIPGTERVLGQLDRLERFVEKLGPDIPVDKAAHVKRTWDRIASKAGLFGPRATASATDNADAWAIREASGSFRQLLNSNPTIAALNAEAAFWTGLKGVLRETQKRTQAQAGTGLVAAGTGGAGAVIGATTGDGGIDNAIIGGLAGRQLVKVVQSPAFRTSVSGPVKDKLADALASGSAERIASAVGRITASLPSQLAE